MPLFETLPVDADAVSALVAQHWGLTLGERLKASQNHTYAATDAASGARYAVRVTPDPAGRCHGRVEDELAFVSFLADRLPGVCAPLRARDGALAVRDGALTLCAVRWAEGAPVDFMSYCWMTDAALVEAWGACFARVHAASREFAAAHPDVAARMRRWDELHDGVLAGAAIAPEDAAAAADPTRFGVLHSDLNVSNFHTVEDAAGITLHVFDWDQVARGWWEYDLSTPLLGALMLAEGGSLPAGDPVPQADVAALEERLVAGYEAVAGAGSVDRPRLRRMLQLRKTFCFRFCRQAAQEGSAPPEMAWYIDYINRWMARAPPAAE